MSTENQLFNDSITFGKYKNGTLSKMLRDRSYCSWLLEQEWFKNSYEFLYNRVKEYNPQKFFIKEIPPNDSFLLNYKYFNLTNPENLSLDLSDEEKKCYTFYCSIINDLKSKIEDKLDTENPYDIKAPTRWLKKFEKEYNLSRDVFKEFLSAYELPNITYIVEDIKKEGGIEYKGAQSFNIAKKRSLEQEQFWENILKQKYGEDISVQYKYEDCFFDFLNISTCTIFECKLSLKDFNAEQYRKYLLALKKYRIIYLISYDCVIDMEKKKIYTTDEDKYINYQNTIWESKKPTKFDKLIADFIIIHVDELSVLFGTD